MWIKQITSGPMDNNTYIVADPTAKEAIVIDVPYDSCERIVSYVKKNALTVKGIFFTHSHFDHFADAKKLQDALKCPIYVHKDDQDNLENPGIDGIPFGSGLDPVKVDHFLKDEDMFSVGQYNFVVIHTPGHTPGGICFYCPEERVLFTGDILFKGSYGRIDLPRANPSLLFESLKRLVSLPEETVVYPGHIAETTTIHAEKPWVQKLK